MPAAVPKPTLSQLNNDSFPDNNLGEISPADLRDFNSLMIASLVDEIPFGTYTASVATSLSALNTYTASQQPTYTALNSFTASQLTINTGVNSFTQSATGRLNNLENTTSSLNAWSSSINQILVNGVSIGTSTRFFFNGFVSASIIPNVGGAIASITVLSDPSLTTTASFNAYTASTNTSISNLNQFTASTNISITNINTTTASLNTSVSNLNSYTASQNSFNSSATASISQLLSFSSSLDATFATDAQLAAVSSSLNDSINTKLNTSSFNSYTASTNTLLTGYATTGSNTFVGSQIINSQLYVSSSSTSDISVNGQVFISSSTSGSANQAKLTISGAVSLSNGSRASQVVIGAGAVTLTRATTSGTNNIGFTSNGIINTYGYAASIYAQVSTGSNTATIGTAFNDSALLVDNELQIASNGTGNYLRDYDNTIGDYSTFMFIAPNDGETIPLPTFTRGLTITGSAYGNVSASVITSQTASIDLSKANYFTLTLSGSTNINVTNVRPGVTATLVVSCGASGSATFSSNVKQVSGSAYQASPSGSTDIISLTSVNTSSVYLLPAYTFV